MADHSKIEWTDATWNIITGCQIVSPGCTNCYAMRLSGTRLQHTPSRVGLTQDSKSGPVWTGEVRFNEQWIEQPLHWRKSRNIFVCAHGDLFHEGVRDEWLRRIFAVMREAPWHRFQILTKRPHRMRLFLENVAPMPHVWIGVSAERQQEADERRVHLATIAAAGWNTWVSYEPALGMVDWRGWEFIRWLVSGGESGPRARPSHPDWHRAARDWCAAAGVAYFMKQHGEWCDYTQLPIRANVWDRTSKDKERPMRGRISWHAYNPSVEQVLYDGREFESDMPFYQAWDCGPIMLRVGKRVAGRQLDGVTHDGVPG